MAYNFGDNRVGFQAGEIHGSVHASFHPPPEQPETPPTPFALIPFLPDPDFVDRGDILDRIEQRCSKPPHRTALVGLGGVGKSQLAIQFAHQVRQQSPSTYVFWVHASTHARFEEAYRSIADSLRLPKRHDPQINVLRLVFDWLSREENGQWLLVLDNADNVDIFYPKSQDQSIPTASAQQGLASFLPQCSNGRIVITSRSRDAAEQLSGGHWNTLPLSTMDDDQAKLLLRKKLQDEYEEEVATDLVHTLECMPLAITHAAAYILRAPHMSPSRYLETFRTSNNAKASLLNRNMGDIRRDASAANSVVVTWQITFEQIRRERPSAADLLSLMSFFHPQGIPKWVLLSYQEKPREETPKLVRQGFRQRFKEGILTRMPQIYQQRRRKGKAIHYIVESEDHTEVNELDNSIEDDIAVLHGYSLVELSKQEDTYKMHALVQFCTQIWLSSPEDIERWRDSFLRLMSMAYPGGEYENWTACQQLGPHIEMILETQHQNDKSAIYWAELLTNAAWYDWRIGEYERAEKRLRKANKIGEGTFNEGHPATLMSVSILALVLQYQGRYDEAEQMSRRALDGYEKALGPEHPDTLTSVSNLASVLQDQGRYDEARQMNRRALDGCEKALGPEHPDTLTSVDNLASILQAQGRYDEAEQMNRRALNN